MKKTIFIADIGEEVGNLSEIIDINRRFKTYEIEVIENQKFIVGKGKPDFFNKNELVITGVDLVLSLVNLVKGDELPKYYNAPHLDNVMLDEDILKWVEKYGIPYQDKKLNEIYGDGLWRFNYLHLDSFKYLLAWLYASFSLWKATIEENWQQINKYKHAARTLNLFKIDDKKEKPNKPTDEIILIKKALAESVGNEARIQLGLRYNPETKQNMFTLHANSLFEIAYFQLASLMTKTPTESKASLKNCKMCNNLFWAEHGNEAFCNNPKCNKRNYWYHKNKKKRK